MFPKTEIWLPVFLFLHTSLACDILGATGCPKEPESALKNEDFLEYCEQFRSHLECVFEMYEGCDRKGKYAMAMVSMVKGLNKKIRKVEKLCERDFGILETDGADEAVEATENTEVTSTRKQKRRRRTTTSPTTTTEEITTTTMTTTTTTSEPCEIELISTDCHPILTSVQYIESWSDQVKTRWCNSATPYFNCIKMRMFNCEASQKYAESFEYYSKIRNYVETESNKSCPGGIEGCIVNPADSRCRQGPKFKNMIEHNSAIGSIKLSNKNLLFFSVVFFVYKSFE